MTSTDSLPVAWLAVARENLASSLEKIEHCLAQLPDADLAWRPFESANSITNIILHLCGNVRQWIISGVGRAKDVRNRPLEFSDRRVVPKAELLERLRTTVREADAVLAKLPPEDLLAQRRIQGFAGDATTLSAIFDTLTHFRGHTQEIIYITRLRLTDRYQFHWQPKGAEQGAAV
jgi:hypothetical protein